MFNFIRNCVVVVGVAIVFKALVFAHEGYMTTYNHHIKPGEFEIMLMNDFTSPSEPKRENDGHNDYLSQMIEIEYAPSTQLAFEFMMEGFEDLGSKEVRFTGFRYETRYRVFKDEVPLNPVIYAEYEDLHLNTRFKMETSGWVEPPYEEEEGGESSRESIMETRLILSQDFGPWNVAFNWINESDLNSGVTAFGYSLGVFYTLLGGHKEGVHVHNENSSFVKPMYLGFELFGALGDSKKLDLQPSRQEHYFQPTITVHIGEFSMFTTGFAIGLTKSSDNIVRMSYGLML